MSSITTFLKQLKMSIISPKLQVLLTTSLVYWQASQQINKNRLITSPRLWLSFPLLLLLLQTLCSPTRKSCFKDSHLLYCTQASFLWVRLMKVDSSSWLPWSLKGNKLYDKFNYYITVDGVICMLYWYINTSVESFGCGVYLKLTNILALSM